MTKEFILQGLNCANCAAKIEGTVKKTEGVLSASVNISTSKLKIVTNETYPTDIHKIIESIVHNYEPDVLVLESSKSKGQSKSESNAQSKSKSKALPEDAVNKSTILWLATGTFAFIAGMLFEFVFVSTNENIALGLFAFSYILLGGKVLLRMFRNLVRGQIFDENFLMGVATLGAIAIGKYAEAVTVMLFYQIGEFFQEMAVAKSKKRIGELMDIRPDFANLKINGQIIKVDPYNVQIGDVFVVKPGEKIPLDGIVVEGEAMLDTSALTGESVPRKAAVSASVLSGCINLNGVLTIQATQTFGESTVSKILDLVENAADKKAPTETFIAKFARYYTPTVVILAAFLAIIPPLFLGGDWMDWINRALIFLVISCPCALVVSIPLGFFGGIGGASKKGILVKGGNYLEALANLDMVVFDKTGTLTQGIFKVTAIQPAGTFTEKDLLEAAAYAEAFSNHPIALSILKEYGKSDNKIDKKIDKESLSQYEEIAGYGVSVHVEGNMIPEGNTIPVGNRVSEENRAPEGHRILAGNGKLMDMMGITYKESRHIGTKVYVAIDGTYAGCIVIADEIKPDSHGLTDSLRSMGIKKTIMLTGDTPQIAETIAAELKLDEVYASLLPQQKVEKMEMLSKEKPHKKTLAFVGDGINDAPVLAMADVGIAMGGLGSDAAIEAADVVLMTDEPAKLVEAIKIARFTKRVVWQNIVVSLGVKILFLFLATLGVSSLWEAVFADVGVSLLAVFNSMRIMRR